MARVLISAGHTSMDPGAIFQDLREADLTRKIAKHVVSQLETAQIEVQAVPLDLPLFQRLEWINNTGYTDESGDILVEIHINDGDGTKRGIEAWYRGDGDNNSQKLAAVLVDTVTADTKHTAQGIRSEYDHELGMLTFLNRSQPAAVVIETLFIDNPDDANLLKEDAELEKLGKSIAQGIARYLGKTLAGADLPPEQQPKLAELVAKYNKSQPRPKNPMAALPALNPNPIPSASLPSPATGGTGSSVMQDREQRKKMIEDYYLKILGRAAAPNDLNFFLNRGTSELELLKKMVESQEHVDLLKSKHELDELKTEHDSQTQQLKRMEATLNDMKSMLKNLNAVITHKNRAIAKLEELIRTKHGLPSGVVENQSGSASAVSHTQTAKSSVKFSEGTSERFFRTMRKLLS